MQRIPRQFTTTEAELRSLVAQGMKFTAIATKLRIQVNAIRTTASVLGIASPCGSMRASVAGTPLAEVVSRLERGATLKEIGDASGVTRQAVMQALRAAGLPTCTREAVKAKFNGVDIDAVHRV